MKFKHISVKNFRNLKNINLDISNKNVLFGMNDAGKTNFLQALAFLLDWNTRKNGFNESDYFKKNTSEHIEICLEVDISDYQNDLNSEYLISKVKGARHDSNLNSIFIKLIGEYDNNELFGEPKLWWGSDFDNLEPISTSNSGRTPLDSIFNIVYISPSVDMDKIFRKNKRRIFNVNDDTNDDELIQEIDNLSNKINNKISSMKTVKKIEESVNTEYVKLKDEPVRVKFQSEMAVNGIYDYINPYIQIGDNENNLYPTSGEGRKKFLSYSFINYITQKYNDNKITVYLFDEPENSLHKSMQIALSRQLYRNEDNYKFFFMATHSSEILSAMDKSTLIRVNSEDNLTSKSYFYDVQSVAPDFSQLKKELNDALSSALFYKTVLLVEGPSEEVLFDKVLSVTNPNYELAGGMILRVDGVKFNPYYKILTNLGIKVIVKTDNDIIKNPHNHNEYLCAGYNRAKSFLDDNKKKKFSKDQVNSRSISELKSELYNSDEYRELENHFIFLSENDLEHDLNEALGENRFSELIDNNHTNAVHSLQSRKLINMIALCNQLTNEDCQKIVADDRFKCLREL